MKLIQSCLSSSPETSVESSSEHNSPKSTMSSDLSIRTFPSLPSLQRHLSNPNLDSAEISAESLPPRNLPITFLAVHENLLYSASSTEINVYDRRDEAPIDSFAADGDYSSGSIKSVAFCQGMIFTAHQDTKIRVWKMKNNHTLVTSLPTVGDRLRRFVNPKNYVKVRRHVKTLWIEHSDAVSGLAVGDGVIYSVSWDRSLKVWRASDLRCLESVNGAHDDAINAVTVSPSGIVYTGSADRRIRVWKRSTEGKRRHALVATLEKHRSAVNALALNGDGTVLFSGSCDKSILAWERDYDKSESYNMTVVGALRGHNGAVLTLFAVSDLLVSGSADRTVRIWRRGNGGVYFSLAVLEGHLRPVKSLTAVTEGSDGVVTVFSGGLDGETKVWKVSVTTTENLRINKKN